MVDQCFHTHHAHQVFVFQLEHCAAESLLGDTILCPDYNIRIPLHHLVPDLLLTDLPTALKIDTSMFEFNPQDPATKLGRGGAGMCMLYPVIKIVTCSNHKI